MVYDELLEQPHNPRVIKAQRIGCGEGGGCARSIELEQRPSVVGIRAGDRLGNGPIAAGIREELLKHRVPKGTRHVVEAGAPADSHDGVAMDDSFLITDRPQDWINHFGRAEMCDVEPGPTAALDVLEFKLGQELGKHRGASQAGELLAHLFEGVLAVGTRRGATGLTAWVIERGEKKWRDARPELVEGGLREDGPTGLVLQ
jgi:hypothetical protein